MFKFFDMITDFIEIIVNLVITSIKQIFYIFTFITQGSLYLGSVVALLPTFISVSVSAIVGFAVIRAVLDYIRGS